MACSFLKERGYVVLRRNVRVPGGEIDIVARSPIGILVFVEVKTLSGESEALMPEDNANAAKLIKMRRSAMIFAGSHNDLFDEKNGWQIDLVAVVLANPPKIRHYENV